MALAGRFDAGNDLLFTCKITDTATGDLVDPTEVAFSYAVDKGTPTVTKYPADDVITRVSQGTYTCSVGTRSMALDGDDVLLTGQWEAEGTYNLSESIDVLVGAPEIVSAFG